jgi:hypothetical protein
MPRPRHYSQAPASFLPALLSYRYLQRNRRVYAEGAAHGDTETSMTGWFGLSSNGSDAIGR